MNTVTNNVVKTTSQVALSKFISATVGAIGTAAGITATAPGWLIILGSVALGMGIDYAYSRNFLGIKDSTRQVVKSVGDYFNNRTNFEVDLFNSKNQTDLSFYDKGLNY